MWLIPFSYGEPHTLSVTFNKAETVAGLRIWNYNKSPEDSYRGVRRIFLPSLTTIDVKQMLHVENSPSVFQVKVIHVLMDDVAISPSEGFLIRKGPGNCHFDFAQEILFIDFLQTPTDNKSAEDYHK